MNNTMEYKDYVGSVEFSAEDMLLYGKVMGIRTFLSYEGENIKELMADFHQAVDDYLARCEKAGAEPERAYKGSLHIHVAPELHRRAAVAAASRQISLNSFVEKAIQNAVQAFSLAEQEQATTRKKIPQKADSMPK